MQTTNALVELLVVGVLAQLWLAPILVRLAPSGAGSGLSSLMTGLLMLAMIYFVGVVFNVVANLVVNPFESWLLRRNERTGAVLKKDLQFARAVVINGRASASDYLSVRRSIVRTLRAGIVAFPIAAIVWATMKPLGPHQPPGIWLTFMAVAGVCAYGYARSVVGYWVFVLDSKEIISGD